MTFRLFDTATGQVRAVVLREPDKVSLYVCGPTVYDFPHVGHGRAVLTYDVLRRYLTHRGYDVHHVSNITDIEDKIINRAQALGVPWTELTQRYEDEWYKAMDALDALRPHEAPHATEYVEQMVAMIAELIERKFAYETDDTVYFSSERVADYGLLARQSVESLQAGARVEQDEAKRSQVDFALWKKIQPRADEPTWPSPWGPGRPGWHSECVVMSLRLLGDGFDIHSGGLDLAFPHHENERAQASAWNHAFASHWMHHGFVEVDGEKMSKSLGNFTSLTDLLARHDGRAYRLLILRAHYRSPLEVTPESLGDAEAALSRLDDFARRFADDVADEFADDEAYDTQVMDSFYRFMDDDLDTPNAVAVVFSAVREANAALDKGEVQKARLLARSVINCCESVGLTLFQAKESIDAETQTLIDERDAARSAKDWAKADMLRDKLVAQGWIVRDGATGTVVHSR